MSTGKTMTKDSYFIQQFLVIFDRKSTKKRRKMLIAVKTLFRLHYTENQVITESIGHRVYNQKAIRRK